MTTRSRGPLAGFEWLKRGINVGHGNPKALLGGAALLLLMCMLPSAITMPVQFGMLGAGVQPSMTVFGAIMAFSMLAGLLLVPLYAGYLRLIDASERGLPVRARDIFKPYREGEVLRLVGYGVAMLVVYAAVFAIVIAATGGSLVTWYMQVLAAQASHQLPPTLPAGFGLALGLFVVLGLFMIGVYAISLGQVALGRRSVLGAVGDGMVGALKNLLPLLVFLVSLIVAWLLVGLFFVLVVGVVALLGKLVGAWLMLVIAVPLYVGFALVAMAVMFGVMYHLWRDVCGDDAAPATQAVAA